MIAYIHRRPVRTNPLYWTEAGAVAAFIWHQFFVASSLTSRHGLSATHLLALGIMMVPIGWALERVVDAGARFIAGQSEQDRSDSAGQVVRILSPFLLLYLVFLPYAVFLEDFVPLLLPLAFTGSFYLFFSSAWRLPFGETFRRNLKRLGEFFRTDRTSSRTSVALFFLSLLVYTILDLGIVCPMQPLTGDEPHYLLISSSILADGDVDLANNYRNRDYSFYYPGQLDLHAYPGRKRPGELHSKHSAGLPFLLTPFYLAGREAGHLALAITRNPEAARRTFIKVVRYPMCILTALLGLFVFLQSLEMTRSRKTALSIWFLFSFAFPTLFYSQLIYPEVPAALITLLVFRYLVWRKTYTPTCLFFGGAGIAVLPWLGIKYSILSAILLITCLHELLRQQKKSPKQYLLLSALPVFSILMLMNHLWALYGNFSPFSTYGGIVPRSTLSISGFWDGSLRFGLASIFDRQSGILPYAPVYLLCLAGMLHWLKQTRRRAVPLAVIFACFWVLVALTQRESGNCPPGRPLLSVFWILALFLSASFAQPVSRIMACIRRVLTAVTLFMPILALSDPWLLYPGSASLLQKTVSGRADLWDSVSTHFIHIRAWMPALTGPGGTGGFPLIVWLSLLAAVTLLLFFKSKEPGRPAPAVSTAKRTLSVFALSLLIIGYRFFDVRLERPAAIPGSGYKLFFQDSNSYAPETGGFWTRGGHPAELFLQTDIPLTGLSLELWSPSPGRTDLQVGRQRTRIERRAGDTSPYTARFSTPAGFRLKGSFLYRVRIEAHEGFVPGERDGRFEDSRNLGVFVKIGTRVN